MIIEVACSVLAFSCVIIGTYNMRKTMRNDTKFSVVASVLFCIVLLTCSPSFAQVIKNGQLADPVTIVVYALVKKGDGCTQVTKRARFPLSREECRELLESYGRKSPVDDRNPMMIVLYDPVIYPGDVFVYVQTPNGKGWIFQGVEEYID